MARHTVSQRITLKKLDELAKKFAPGADGPADDNFVAIGVLIDATRELMARQDFFDRFRHEAHTALTRAGVPEGGRLTERIGYLSAISKGGEVTPINRPPEAPTTVEQANALARDLAAERDEARNTIRAACIVLADEFVPDDQRFGAHLRGLEALVVHAAAHHRWHHDAADSTYVRQLEVDLERANTRVAALQAAFETPLTEVEMLGVRGTYAGATSEAELFASPHAEQFHVASLRLAVERAMHLRLSKVTAK